MTRKTAENSYVERILGAAKELKFPSWYLAKIESFLDHSG
jgi:hypothetical protein